MSRSTAAAWVTRMVSLIAALGLTPALVGCSEERPVTLWAKPASDGGASRIVESYLQGVEELDILVIVDNTVGMLPAQQALAEGLGRVLEGWSTAAVDWRLGVISSDLGIESYFGPGCTKQGGDGAVLQDTPRIAGCSVPARRYLSSSETSDPARALRCILLLGENGCGFERPFQAAIRALAPSVQPAANRGFLRESADLLLLWLTNEDDCSAADAHFYDPDDVSLGAWTSYRCFAQDIECTGTAADGTLTGCASGKRPYLTKVGDVAGQLRSLKAAGSIITVAVTGPSSPVRVSGTGSAAELAPSCSSATISARPAIRFHELMTELGAAGGETSICDPQLSQQLLQTVGRLAERDFYCLRHELRDPGVPGCSVEVTPPGGVSYQVPASGPGGAGFFLFHPLVPGCAWGALSFDAAARPARGSTVRVSCAFVP